MELLARKRANRDKGYQISKYFIPKDSSRINWPPQTKKQIILHGPIIIQYAYTVCIQYVISFLENNFQIWFSDFKQSKHIDKKKIGEKLVRSFKKTETPKGKLSIFKRESWSSSLNYRLIIMRSSHTFFIPAITWHDIQQLSINLPEFTKVVQLMNWQNNSSKFL